MHINFFLSFFFLLFLQRSAGQPRISISFQPSDSSVSVAAGEYQRIWKEEGQRMVNVLEGLSGMKFLDSAIIAFVAELPSSSGNNIKSPITLRASYSNMMKRATLVHELGHRLMFSLTKLPPNFNEHELLFLFLFDAWLDLFGEEHAKKMVEVESARKNPSNDYKRMWEQALSLTREQRRARLLELVNTFQ